MQTKSNETAKEWPLKQLVRTTKTNATRAQKTNKRKHKEYEEQEEDVRKKKHNNKSVQKKE